MDCSFLHFQMFNSFDFTLCIIAFSRVQKLALDTTPLRSAPCGEGASDGIGIRFEWNFWKQRRLSAIGSIVHKGAYR